MISIIVPCFNEQESLPLFYEEAKKVLEGIEQSYEMLFVNDGSSDGTLDILRELSEKDTAVKYLSFSRNFGKESAMYAGLQHAKGDYVVMMDADLQHPPAMLEEMYLAIKEEGYDVVAARRVSRKGEPLIRSLFSRCFYRIINKISSAEFVDGASDFRMFSRKVVDAMVEMGEYNRFLKGIFGWVGFKTKWVPYENVERVAGGTSWSFWKLFLYSLEGIIAFSTVPLGIISIIGVMFFVVAFVWMIGIIVRTLIWGDPVAGFPTLACMLLLIGGSIQLSLGIIGQYLAKTYLETKRRPHYIIAETNERKQNEDKQV
ncbi:MAG: glycosyltransferase family 2 protein [Lachnospiraceae bacterium]|nr:glycosyltransferase family 2 protein [Lachnospiraceae bacterium]